MPELTHLDLSDVLGWIAVLTFVVRLIPQPVRLARTGIPDGVSALAALNIALTEAAWFIYGLSQGSVPVWIVSVPAFPLGVWTVVLLWPETTRRDLVATAAWGALIVGSWAVGVLGLVLALAVIVQFGPQVWLALRSDQLAGISRNAWRLSILDGCIWGAYAITISDWAIIGYASVLIVFAVIILARVRHTRSLTPAAAV